MANLRDLRGTPLTVAQCSQRRVAKQRRDALRELLRGAARRGLLRFGETQLHEFVDARSKARRIVVDLTLHDEQLEDDARVMIDVRSPSGA
jgi:hypothetical protein